MRAKMRFTYWVGRIGTYSGRFAKLCIDFNPGEERLHDAVLARLLTLDAAHDYRHGSISKQKIRIAVGLSGKAGSDLIDLLIELFREYGSQLVLLPSSVLALIDRLRDAKSAISEDDLLSARRSLLTFSLATYPSKELAYFYHKIEDSIGGGKDGDAVYYLYQLIENLSWFDGSSGKQEMQMIEGALKQIVTLAGRIEILDLNRIYAQECLDAASLKQLLVVFMQLHCSQVDWVLFEEEVGSGLEQDGGEFSDPWVLLNLIMQDNQSLKGLVLPVKSRRFSSNALLLLLDTLAQNTENNLTNLVLDNYGVLSAEEYESVLEYASANHALQSLGNPKYHQNPSQDLQRACQIAAVFDRRQPKSPLLRFAVWSSQVGGATDDGGAVQVTTMSLK